MQTLRVYELARDVTKDRNESFWYDVIDRYPIEKYIHIISALGIDYESFSLGDDIMMATLGLKKSDCFLFGLYGNVKEEDCESMDFLCETHLDAIYIQQPFYF